MAVVLCLGMLAGNVPYAALPALAEDTTTGITETVELQQADPLSAPDATAATITAVDAPAEITMPVGTAQEALGLPAVLTGRYDGGTVDVPVTWSCDSYAADTADTYTFTASATAPEGFALAEGLTLPALTVTLQAADTPTDEPVQQQTLITAVNTPAAITAPVGTQQADLGLPAALTGQYDGGTVEVPVTWSCDSYAAETAGEYTFTASATAPEGFALAEGLTLPTQTVTLQAAEETPVTITAVDTPAAIEVPVGTQQADLGLPAALTGHYDGGTVEVPVSWTCENYAPDTAGTYTFTAAATAPENFALAESILWPVITVTVTEASAPQSNSPAENRNQVALLAGTIVASGSLTPTITYTIEDDGNGYVLTINGTGAMPDYTPAYDTTPPWCEDRTFVENLYKVVINEGITHVGDYSFYNNFWAITSLSLPSSLVSIGEYAFYYAGVTELDLSNSANLETIGQGSFGCASLASVDLSNCTSLTEIGGNAFFNLKSLKTVNLSGCTALNKIGNGALSYCSDLESVDLSDCAALETIDRGAFFACSALNNVDLSDCTALTTMESSAFSGCTSLTTMDLSGHTNLTSLGKSAFSNCKNLNAVDLSDCTGITSIAESLFDGCTKLQSVELTGCTDLNEIGANAFASCSALRTIAFPEPLTSVDSTAFQGCTALTVIGAVIPDDTAINGLQAALAGMPQSAKQLTVYADEDGTLCLNGAFLQTLSSDTYDFYFGNTDERVTFVQGTGAASVESMAPLNALQGAAYIDADGVVYLLTENGKTATLAYVPHGLSSYRVPASISVPNSSGTGKTTYSVKNVAAKAVARAFNLNALIFASPSAVTLADFALAICPSLRSVNGKTTVEDASALFQNTGDSAFFGSGLTVGADPQRADPTGPIELEAPAGSGDQAYMRLSVSQLGQAYQVEDNKIWVTGTGNPVTLAVNVWGSNADKYQYRLYLRSPDVSINLDGLNLKEEEPSVDKSTGITMVLHKSTEMAGLYYVDVTVPSSLASTWTRNFAIQYNASSPGGSLIAWVEQASKSTQMLVSTSPSGKYFEFFWETEPAPYTMTLTRSESETFSYTRVTPEEPVVLDSNLAWKATLNAGSREQYQDYPNLAVDPARAASHTFTFVLPAGLGWNCSSEIQQALANGASLKISGNDLTLNGVTILSVVSNTANTGIIGGTATLSSGKLSVTMLQSSNNVGGFTASPEVTVTLPASLVKVTDENSFDYTTSKQITVTAQSAVEYAFSPEIETTQATVSWNSVEPKGQVMYSKTTNIKEDEYIKSYNSVYYDLTAENATVMPKTLTEITDALPISLYITPTGIGKLFTLQDGNLDNRDLSQYLTLTITNARVYQYTNSTGALGQVTLLDGSTRKTLTAEQTDIYSTLYQDQVTVTVKKVSDTQLSVKIGSTDAETVPIDSLETYFTNKGIAVTADTVYTPTWSFGSKYMIPSGDVYQLRIPVRPKSTFQQLTEDQLMFRGAEETQIPQDYSKETYEVTNTANFSGETNGNESATLKYRLDCAIGKTQSANKIYNGQVLDYQVTFYQQTYSRNEFEGLPVVDVMSGIQCLLAPVTENQGQSWVTEVDPEIYTDSDGVQYYRMEVPAGDGDGRYVYHGVWLNGQYADTVTVIRYDALTAYEKEKYKGGQYDNMDDAIVQDGYVTETRWYLAGVYSSETFSYKSLVDLKYSQGASATEPNHINNVAYLNDRDGRRVFFPTGTIPVYPVSGSKIFVDSKGNPQQGENRVVAPGETVYYRLSVINNLQQACTVNTADIWDELPSTYGVFAWDKTRVSVRYDYAKSSKDPGNFNWNIQNSGSDYQIRWQNGVTVPASDTLYIYVSLTYPEGGGQDSEWQKYVDAVGKSSLTNTFRLINETHSVSHVLAQPSYAYLQKGVREADFGTVGSEYELKDLTCYLEPDESGNKTEVTFYALVYNEGPGLLYLTELQDRVTGSESTHSKYKTDLRLINSRSQFTNLPANVELLEADITGTLKADSQGDVRVFTFAPSDTNKDMDTIQYDAGAQAYYLEPNQAIAFSYDVSVNGADDTVQNTLTMPLYDPNGVGMYMASDISQVRNNYDMAGKVPNDGSCDAWNGTEATTQEGFTSTYKADRWLYSDVFIRRGDTIPGLQKRALNKRGTSGTVTECTGFAGLLDDIQWEVSVHNTGENILKGYTITDTFPVNYTLTDGDVVITNQYYYNGDQIRERSKTLFAVNGFTKGSNGRVKSIKIDNRTVTVGGSPYSTDDFSVAFSYTGNNQLVMELQIKDKDSLYGTVLPGFTPRLTYWTEKYTDTEAYTAFVNTAVLTLPDQQVNYEGVTTGVVLWDDNGNGTGVKAMANVTITGGYSTRAIKKVAEQGNPGNTTDSQAGGAIQLSQQGDGYSGFTYTLMVDNSVAGQENDGMQWLTIIDNLPEPDDTLTLNQIIPRNSDFKVQFQSDPDVKVWYETSDGQKRYLTSSATIRYSTKTVFSDNDWGTVSSAPIPTGWTSSPGTTARSIRISLRSTSSSPIIPAGATVYVTFNCKVAGDGSADVGGIAWNSFGYRYQMSKDRFTLESAPLEVGVQIPDSPRIQKTLVSSSGTSQTATEDTQFEFLVYKGAKPENDPQNAMELLQWVISQNISMSIVTVDLSQGESTGTEKLTGMVKYNFGLADSWPQPTSEEWTWENGEQYTVVELGTHGSLYDQLGINGDYSFHLVNGSALNCYTFTYSSATSQLIHFENTRDSRELNLLKVDASNNMIALEGAIFALYSNTVSDQLNGTDFDNACSAVGLSSAQKDMLTGSKTIMVNVSGTQTRYYLAQLGKSDEYGRISWKDLAQDQYCYMELWAPQGYEITNKAPVLVDFTETGSQFNTTVTNQKTYILPETGGPGRWQIPVLGFGLCTLAVLVLYKKRRRRGA